MIADILKGSCVMAAKLLAGLPPLQRSAFGWPTRTAESSWPLPLRWWRSSGRARHNYSLWMAVKKRHFARTGKDSPPCRRAARLRLAVLHRRGGHRLTVIALTRYMLAGQVGPLSPALAASYSVHPTGRSPCSWRTRLRAHHRRFVGLLHGEEPKLYVNDRQAPRLTDRAAADSQRPDRRPLVRRGPPGR